MNHCSRGPFSSNTCVGCYAQIYLLLGLAVIQRRGSGSNSLQLDIGHKSPVTAVLTTCKGIRFLVQIPDTLNTEKVGHVSYIHTSLRRGLIIYRPIITSGHYSAGGNVLNYLFSAFCRVGLFHLECIRLLSSSRRAGSLHFDYGAVHFEGQRPMDRHHGTPRVPPWVPR